MNQERYQKSVRQARIGMWLATRASRNTGVLDRLCRMLLTRMTRVDPDNDFMRDEVIEQDAGFSVEELERYERGE